MKQEFGFRIDPNRLILLLEQAGWELVGGQEGFYSRLAPIAEEAERQPAVIIPLNPGAPDFPDLMENAVHQLQADFNDTWSRFILPRLRSVASDSVRFRKESDAPSGLIRWDDGQAMIKAARSTLLAGAKAFMEPARHFSNRNGMFANRYVDAVLMGQTLPGSYVVTAYVPLAAKIPIRSGQTAPMEFDGVDVASGREITGSVVKALRATTDALAEYRTEQTVEVFEQRVKDGISYEMVTAIAALSEDSHGSEISVEWDKVGELRSESKAETERFEFSEQDTPILHKVASTLINIEPIKGVRVLGRVHLLTQKEKGGPGVVGLDDGKNKYRVRFHSDDAYHQAVLAHYEERSIQVEGELSQEGTLRWLYGATLLGFESLRKDALAEPGPPRLF